jgi:uncharacterized RDD family membrane protein YckC
MKCPKCGYLGFETTDRCRNCQYDFSLAPFAHEPELTLHNTRQAEETASDFDLEPIKRQTDSPASKSLDLDRLFGETDAEPPLAQFGPTPPTPFPEPAVTVIDTEAEPEPSQAPAEVEAAPSMMFASESTEPPAPEPMLAIEAPASVTPAQPFPSELESEGSALPFDEAPIVPPPAARTPLAVRRSTPELPRNRTRTTRPLRQLDLSPPSTANATSIETEETIKSLLESPSVGVRVGAGMIDVLLLAAIDAAIAYLTLKVSGLESTIADLNVLPPVPFVGFLALLAFGYVASFTVAGGQTIGKMLLSLRVIGDDGRPIDAAGGMIRALGCMLVPATLGLSFLPAIFTSDQRAIHDRLAGTRVVQE